MNANTTWNEPAKDEIEKAKAEQQFMELLARFGGRTLGVELPGDKKGEPK